MADEQQEQSDWDGERGVEPQAELRRELEALKRWAWLLGCLAVEIEIPERHRVGQAELGRAWRSLPRRTQLEYYEYRERRARRGADADNGTGQERDERSS